MRYRPVWVALTKATSTADAIVDLSEAKTSLLQLVERAAAGEEIIIAKAGKPKAHLVPLAAAGPGAGKASSSSPTTSTNLCRPTFSKLRGKD
jgi:prevent-host-death family protein